MTAHLLDRVARIAVLVLLLALATYVTLLSSLGDVDQTIKDRRYISETVVKGPGLIGGIEWRLDSLREYTRLAGKDGEQLEIELPAKATFVVAQLSLTPTERADVNIVTCEPDLLDDRGNMWRPTKESLYDYPLPTSCYSDDAEMTIGKTTKVAIVYIVPKEAVPHLVGIAAPEAGSVNFRSKERVLLTP
jgi:hypothetical protein